MFKVAILGCPNVGKSTLFNTMVKKRQAITHDTPGVTRDCNEGICQLIDGQFIVIDSPGWSENDQFSAQMKEKVINLINTSNLILFVIGAQITLSDQEFSLWLRKNAHIPVTLIVNKCETELDGSEHELGWNNIFYTSAKHKIGFSKLYDHIQHSLPQKLSASALLQNDLRITIVGRPNSGKSTFINQLLQENRVIASPIAGTTRDAISVHWRYKSQNITLIDTAGLRKKAKVQEKIESDSTGYSINAIRQANVVILMLDAERGLEHQDITIADFIINEGKSLVIAINKDDTIEKKLLESMQKYCLQKLPYEMFVVSISALHNKSCNKVIDKCLKAYRIAAQTISTGKLNRWLSTTTAQHPPPLSSRKTPIRLKFIAQTAIMPLTFKIIVNIPEDIKKHYIKYLINNLRANFSLNGAPITINLEKNHNPYL